MPLSHGHPSCLPPIEWSLTFVFLRRRFCVIDKMTSMVGSQPRTLANHPCELADIPGRPARANSVSFAHELPECLCLLQGAGERSLLRATLGPAK